MYPNQRDDWNELFGGDAQSRAMGRMMLKDVGSEFAEPRVLEPSLLSWQADAASDAVIVGPDVDEGTNSTYRKLVIPRDSICVLQDLNYWYEEAAQGDLTAAINSAKLRLKVAGEQLQQLPEFALNRFARGSAALRFGTIPLKKVVPAEQAVTLEAIATGGGDSDELANVYISLSMRFEPRWLMEQSGLLTPGNP